MIRHVPIVPTIIVLAAVATLVSLGIWQLGRAEEKARQMILYSKSSAIAEEAPFPMNGDGEDVWFRWSRLECPRVIDIQPVAGTAASGAKGWAMRATCEESTGETATVDIGFSRALKPPQWQGGTITGLIAPGPRLVANPPAGDLQPLAEPNPADLPNNHFAYAGQWFFFALTALVIYGFALRARASKHN